jgi:hypothetical protein
MGGRADETVCLVAVSVLPDDWEIEGESRDLLSTRNNEAITHSL